MNTIAIMKITAAGHHPAHSYVMVRKQRVLRRGQQQLRALLQSHQLHVRVKVIQQG